MKKILMKRGFRAQECESIMFLLKGFGVMMFFAIFASMDQILLNWGF